jgi:hypothetical protein
MYPTVTSYLGAFSRAHLLIAVFKIAGTVSSGDITPRSVQSKTLMGEICSNEANDSEDTEKDLKDNGADGVGVFPLLYQLLYPSPVHSS